MSPNRLYVHLRLIQELKWCNMGGDSFRNEIQSIEITHFNFLHDILINCFCMCPFSDFPYSIFLDNKSWFLLLKIYKTQSGENKP